MKLLQRLKNGELWLINANISSYKNSSKILISDEKEKESYW